MEYVDNNKSSLWKNGGFREFIMINSLDTLAIGIIRVTLPTLVKDRFGIGRAQVVTATLLLFPKIILTPFISRLMVKKRPGLIAGLSMLGLAGVLLCQAWTVNYRFFQATVVLRSIIDIACISSLRTLLAYVIPKGQNTEANGIYLMIERSLFLFLAPFFVRLKYFTTEQYFYIVSGMLLIASLLAIYRYNRGIKREVDEKEDVGYSYFDLLQLFRQKKVLFSLYLPVFGSFFFNSALFLFLFWSSLHTFQHPQINFASLLTARGLGTVLASFIAPWIVKNLSKKISVHRVHLAARLLIILILASLSFTQNSFVAITILILSRLPQAIASVCFFTLTQKTLKKKVLGMVYTLTFPIYAVFELLGSLLGFIYTDHYLSLQGFWLLTSGISLVITLIPMVFLEGKNVLNRGF